MNKPTWIKQNYKENKDFKKTFDLIKSLPLNTVCAEADCPNFTECFSKKTATFMILGKHCTRNCKFCNVTNANPEPINYDEPKLILDTIIKLGLKYVVITSVTRDDLKDYGSEQFHDVCKTIKDYDSKIEVELLVPDFMGDDDALQKVLCSKPDVVSHNMETVKSKYKDVRAEADYNRSLQIIKKISLSEAHAKSGIMLGLGETKEEVIELLQDLRDVNCEFLTIGQYLAPSKKHHPVLEYIHPDTFKEYEDIGYSMGFSFVKSGVFVRSSYNAGEALKGME